MRNGTNSVRTVFYKKNKTQVSRQGMKAGMTTRSNGKQ